jgi:hypothetical protein
MLRNAAIVLGSQGCQEALSSLRQTLERETDPAVQDACRWAISQIKSSQINHKEQ